MAVVKFVSTFAPVIELHSMMSVLPNGGGTGPVDDSGKIAALDDVSATEWRRFKFGVDASLLLGCTR